MLTFAESLNLFFEKPLVQVFDYLYSKLMQLEFYKLAELMESDEKYLFLDDLRKILPEQS